MALFLEVLLPCGFPGGASGKEPACQCRRHESVGSIPGSGRSLGGRNGNPLQYSLPGESHGQRSLVGYSPQGGQESHTTEATWHTHFTVLWPTRGFSFPAVLRRQTLWGVSIPSTLFPSPRPSIRHVLGEWVLTRPLIPVVQGCYFAVCLGRRSSPTSSARLCEQDAGLITSPDADEDQRMGALEC